MNPIEHALRMHGPSRTARLVKVLSNTLGLSSDAARQRLSRARTPVERYPGKLLPKREAFFYIREDRNTERYWTNLLRDLRETSTVYACAIDALDARGGIVPVREFAVVSGAPLSLKKQVPSERVAQQLVNLGIMKEETIHGFGRCFTAIPTAIVSPITRHHFRTIRLTEGVMLDGLRQWIRNNGIGSFAKVSIRGEENNLQVGQFKWDLTGPSYLFSLRRPKSPNGFVVADVFAEGRLDVPHIQYFIRKIQMYQKTSNSGMLFPILMAESFTGQALRAGHAAGLMLTTPHNLFGRQVAGALSNLMSTLDNAAAIAAVDGQRLYDLLNKLSEIEGRAGNMRGIMFELMSGHLAKHAIGGSIDLGVLHTHRETGRQTDLDVVCVDKIAIHLIECKGKGPGGTVSLGEVEQWLQKIPIMKDYVASRDHLRERNQTYALWTTGTFERDAKLRLEVEKVKRTRHPIEWKDGNAVRELAARCRLRAIGEALDQHYFHHPIAS